MADFWRSCGYHLLERGADGQLIVTDDYLRAYYTRPELAPVAASCPNELALHAALMENPRRDVDERQIAALRDEDARENYRVMLRFRAQLVQCYGQQRGNCVQYAEAFEPCEYGAPLDDVATELLFAFLWK